MMIGKVSMFHIPVLENQLWLTLWNLATPKTKVISEASKQGQHTTTFAEMYDLSLTPKLSIRLVLKVLGSRYGAS
jgi:ribosome biogenesis GTPase